MSLGSFVQGAFKGYAFGEDAKDRRTERKRDETRWEWEQEGQEAWRDDREWTGEQRGRTREDWEWTDEQRGRTREDWEWTDYGRGRTRRANRKADALQDALDAIDSEAVEDWNAQGADATPTAPGTVRAPLAPDAAPQAPPAPATTSPAVPGVSVPGAGSPNQGATAQTYGPSVPMMTDRVPLAPRAFDPVLDSVLSKTGAR